MRSTWAWAAVYSFILFGAIVLGSTSAYAQATPTPAPTSTPLAAPSPAGPAILEITVSPEPIRAGKQVSIMVRTTPDVVTIAAHVLTFSFSLPKTGDGSFSGTAKVPWWALFYHGSFQITFVARDAEGTETQMSQTVRI